MTDDIFFDDSEINPIQAERLLADNEYHKLEKEQRDKGYLDGMEWAEL